MTRNRSELSRLKPWWKSIGFWMGIVVTVFLCWAWADSKHTRSWMGWHRIDGATDAVSVGVHWWLITVAWLAIWLSTFALYRRWQLKKIAASGL